MAAYRRLTPNRSRLSSPAAVAAALARLAEYLDDRARFEADTEIADCFGGLWRGLDTDFQPIRRVVEWAAWVRQALPGEGDGRAEARRTLLEGGIDRLEEIRRIAGALPPEWRAARAESGAAAARERARLLDALAGRARALGWSGTEPLGQAAEMAAAIGARQSLADEAAADRTLERVFPNGPPAAETREATLSLVRAMAELGLSDAEWRRIVEIRARGRDAESIRRELEDALGREDAAWSAMSETLEVEEHEFLDGNTRSTAPFAALAARAAECGRAPAALAPWSAFIRARAEATRSHAAPILAAFEEHGVPLQRLGEAYERALYRSLAQAVYARHPELRELAAGELQDHRAAFRDLEDRLQELERERVAHELYFRPVERGESFGGPAAFTEKALIDYQLGLKRSSVNLRDLFGRARRALLQLKPCFMMSPTTVAELLPRERIFDIVIVDEASQMLPCDPLGAIARARRAAIVGDPKQLPPSRFFQGGVVMDEEDDEDAASAANVESILDMALTAWRPARHLLWHYRSRHSGLIQFSNKRFYDNRLIVFPGPDEENGEAGVHYRRVEDGLYSGNRNPAEAKRVVEAA